MFGLALIQSKVQVNDTWLDYFIIAVYFVFVLGIGAILRNRMQTSEDYFLSGRSLPSWVTGLAFLGANLGALEIMGMGAGAAQYGIMQSHYYWIGAIPAMVFVALFMIPFYYASRVHSVPAHSGTSHSLAIGFYIAALVLIFGVTLVLDGLLAPAQQAEGHIGFNVNLWWGLVMVVSGCVILGLTLASPRRRAAREAADRG